MHRFAPRALALLASIGFVLVLSVSSTAREAPAVTWHAQELAPGLFMLEARGGFGGGNIGLLTGTDGVVMIDDSFPPFAETLLEAVKKSAGGPADYVINTHVHGDHTGGNALFDQHGATIVAHDNVRKRLVEIGLSMGGEPEPAPPGALPVITFSDEMSFHLNGHRAHVVHLEHAHTDGDAIIHFPDADVIHTGDIFFHQRFPYIDASSGGGLDGYIAAQKRIHELAGDATKIIPGHGPLATKADLEASIAMLETAKKAIGAMVADGRSLDEVRAADPLADYAEQSWPFITTERMVEQVYRGVGGQ